LLINHHFESNNEEKDFWIIDWFLIVDLVYLIPPIEGACALFIDIWYEWRGAHLPMRA
jgi:hypothetical protein